MGIGKKGLEADDSSADSRLRWLIIKAQEKKRDIQNQNKKIQKISFEKTQKRIFENMTENKPVTIFEIFAWIE